MPKETVSMPDSYVSMSRLNKMVSKMQFKNLLFKTTATTFVFDFNHLNIIKVML